MSFVPQTSSHTAQQVITEVRRTLGDTGGVLFTNDDALSWLNAGQREIANDLALFGEASVDLVAGQRDYVIPVEISRRIRDIQTLIVDGRRLSPLSYVQAQQRWMQRDGGAFPAPGDPKWWYARNQTVSVVPAPEVTAEDGMLVQFTRQPIDLTDILDELDIPDTHYNALTAYVRYRAYLVTQEVELAQASRSEMQELVRSETQREKRTQTNTYFALEPDEELY